MKFVFLSGGLAGLGAAAIAGWLAGHTPDRVLFDGMVGCLAGALLFRWFWSVLLQGVREAYLERQLPPAAAIAREPAPAEPPRSAARESKPAAPVPAAELPTNRLSTPRIVRS